MPAACIRWSSLIAAYRAETGNGTPADAARSCSLVAFPTSFRTKLGFAPNVVWNEVGKSRRCSRPRGSTRPRWASGDAAALRRAGSVDARDGGREIRRKRRRVAVDKPERHDVADDDERRLRKTLGALRNVRKRGDDDLLLGCRTRRDDRHGRRRIPTVRDQLRSELA